MAVGAGRLEVMRMVLRSGLTLALVGVAIGLVAAAGASRPIASLLYGVPPLDPVTFLSAAILLPLVALLASALPAWRATRVDPLVALRTE